MSNDEKQPADCELQSRLSQLEEQVRQLRGIIREITKDMPPSGTQEEKQ
jgi:hypothetical protein